MWKKILVATDLSKASSEVIDCIAHYGKSFTKEAKFAHIISVGLLQNTQLRVILSPHSLRSVQAPDEESRRCMDSSLRSE